MSPPSIRKISLIILNWNGKRDTLECLSSVSAMLDHHSAFFERTKTQADVILVDNGSTDGTVSQVRAQFPQTHIIELPHNLGFAGGNNAAIAHALHQEAHFLLLLNNDTVVAPDLLERFLEGFADHPQAGILGGRIYLFEKREILDHLGGMWKKKKADVQLIGLKEPDSFACLPLDYVCGACLMIKSAVFASIGMLEPRYFLYWEENDFCLRAKQAGFSVLAFPHAKIWHKVSASITGGRPHATYFWWRGRLLWIHRHYSRSEKAMLYLTVIAPEVFKLVKLQALKNLQLCLFRLFRPSEDLTQRREKLLKIRAALAGVRDYFFKRFDQGPAWIYRKSKKN